MRALTWQFAFAMLYFFSVPAFSTVMVSAETGLDLASKRQLFLDAEEAIEAGKINRVQPIIDKLGDYELVPYLQLGLMIEDLHNAKDADVEKFLIQYKGTWLAEKLRLNWLIILDARKRYTDYIRHYPDSTPFAISTCRYAEALIRTGDSEAAFQLAPDLWLKGRSQPEQCDYLFDQWKKSGSYSEEYIWQRFLLARQAGQERFSRYLRRSAKTADIKKRISLYMSIRKDPSLILDPNNISVTEPGRSDLIRYGIQQLATEDPYKAETSLKYYRGRSNISDTQYIELASAIMRGYTRNEAPKKALVLALAVQSEGNGFSESHIDWQLQKALSALDWQLVLDWITLLPAEAAQEEKWRYWKARSVNQLGESAAYIYQNIAAERSYYGFLSAMMIEQPYQLGHKPVTPNALLEDDIKQRPGVRRAAELRAVGYYNNARRAWNYAIADINKESRPTAAAVALGANLHYEAIRAMAVAKYWDDIDIRYPLAYLPEYNASAKAQNVDLSWIYGISRQESNFAPDIRSSSGAMGLMQVLPGTARDMARDIGVRWERDRLKEPTYNIPLGTAYLDKGLRELNGNMVYATAGYNAGINRATIWLNDGRDQLPLDVWIETIPFAETRKYVKYVLAYSVIYAVKLGITSPMEQLSQQFFAMKPAPSNNLGPNSPLPNSPAPNNLVPSNPLPTNPVLDSSGAPSSTL